MKQKRFGARLLALLLAVGLTVGTMPSALAAEDTSAEASAPTPTTGIVYQGQSALQRWLFQNADTTYTTSDLFPEVKGVMPGDIRTQDMIVKNNSAKEIQLFVQLTPHSAANPLSKNIAAETTTESSIQFLNQLELKITAGEGAQAQTLMEIPKGQLGTASGQVALGTLKAKQGTVLHIQVAVPIELGNEFMYLQEKAFQGNAKGIGELDMTFTIQETSSGGGGGGGGGGDDRPGSSEDPKPPEEEIDEPDVPKGEPNLPDEPGTTDKPTVIPGIPVEEMDDPKIPLGDAPKTGDTSQIGLYAGMLLLAGGGLWMMRRKKEE